MSEKDGYDSALNHPTVQEERKRLFQKNEAELDVILKGAPLVGFLEYGPGMRSMGRLLALIITLNGSLAVVAGIGLLIAAIVTRQTEVVGPLIGLVGLGTGADIVAVIMKNWMKNIEVAYEDEVVNEEEL